MRPDRDGAGRVAGAPSQTRTRRRSGGTSAASGREGAGGGRLRAAPDASAARRLRSRGADGMSSEIETGTVLPDASTFQRATDLRIQARKLGSFGSTSGGMRILRGARPTWRRASRREGGFCSVKQARDANRAHAARQSPRQQLHLAVPRRGEGGFRQQQTEPVPAFCLAHDLAQTHPRRPHMDRRVGERSYRRAPRRGAFPIRPVAHPTTEQPRASGRSPGSQVIGAASVFPALRPVTSGDAAPRCLQLRVSSGIAPDSLLAPPRRAGRGTLTLQ